MSLFDPLRQMLGRVRDRDGRAPALEALAVEAPPSTAAAADRLAPAAPLTEAVAVKLLSGWLENRRQTLMPHTLNFKALGPGQADLLLAVMAAAALADGDVDATEERQLPLALDRAGGDASHGERLRALMAAPPALGEVLRDIREAGLGSHAYAAALLAINRASRVNTAFLDYLAARLGLAPDLAASLARRYRS